MPIINSMGSLTARAMGHVATKKKKNLIPDLSAEFAVFNYGNSNVKLKSTLRDVHFVASNTAIEAKGLLNGCSYQTAVGKRDRQMVSCGYAGSETDVRECFLHATNAVQITTKASSRGFYGASAGNNVQALIHIGYLITYLNLRDKYTYADEVCTPTVTSGVNSCSGAAFGNMSDAYFVYGATAAGNVTAIEKVNYATYAKTVAKPLTLAFNLGAATGNGQLAIIAVGGTKTNTNKYTYATDTCVSSSVLTSALSQGSAGGGSTQGIFNLGSTTVSRRNRHVYASGAVTTAYAPTSTSSLGSASGCSISGVNI
jgi:hypothetical protein